MIVVVNFRVPDVGAGVVKSLLQRQPVLTPVAAHRDGPVKSVEVVVLISVSVSCLRKYGKTLM